jgi:hypothetical protein
MFEKSKSEITFKEFQNQMNIANDFDNDWGHFCELDISNNASSPNTIILFKDPLDKPAKREFKKLFQKKEEKHQEQKEELELEKQKEIEKIIKEIFIDVENEKLDENDNNTNYLKDDTKVAIIKNVFKCFEVVSVTSVMVYFIFNIL